MYLVQIHYPIPGGAFTLFRCETLERAKARRAEAEARHPLYAHAGKIRIKKVK
jgi:hypothetical protein